jgi:hypothetical protein
MNHDYSQYCSSRFCPFCRPQCDSSMDTDADARIRQVCLSVRSVVDLLNVLPVGSEEMKIASLAFARLTDLRDRLITVALAEKRDETEVA